MTASPRRRPSLISTVLSGLIFSHPGATVNGSTRAHQSARCVGRGIILGHDCELLRDVRLETLSREGEQIRIGNGCRIKMNVWMCSYGGGVALGNNVLIGPNSVLHGHGCIAIGDDTMLGPGVVITAADHAYWSPERELSSRGFVRAPINIGKNVWIGAGSVITANSQIGDDVVVGAGSVVTGTLASGAVYGGVPAKKIKDIVRESRGAVEHW